MLGKNLTWKVLGQICVWVPESSALKTDLQCEKFNCTSINFTECMKNSFWSSFSLSPPSSLQPLSVHLSTGPLCFEAPFLFVSYCLDFPPSLILSIHLYFHPLLFSPGAYWCSLITGAHWRLLPAALLCEGRVQIRCVRACVCDWVCI